MLEIVDIFLETVDSTNLYAKKNVTTYDAQKVTCITADEQTQGQGRFKRSWFSPKGQNIYSTFYFRLPSQSLHLTSIGEVLCFSLAEVLLKEDLEPKIKWPNDVLLGGKKISGVFCETSFQNEFVDIFLGIGINVNMDESLLSKIDQPATSLYQETKKSWDRQKLLKSLQKQFLSDLEKFKREGFTPFHCCFENLLAFKGEEISCFDGDTKWKGILHSVTCDGQLNLYLPSKEIKTFFAGDITLR